MLTCIYTIHMHIHYTHACTGAAAEARGEGRGSHGGALDVNLEAEIAFSLPDTYALCYANVVHMHMHA